MYASYKRVIRQQTSVPLKQLLAQFPSPPFTWETQVATYTWLNKRGELAHWSAGLQKASKESLWEPLVIASRLSKCSNVSSLSSHLTKSQEPCIRHPLETRSLPHCADVKRCVAGTWLCFPFISSSWRSKMMVGMWPWGWTAKGLLETLASVFKGKEYN